jgi:hypothetical protein
MLARMVAHSWIPLATFRNAFGETMSLQLADINLTGDLKKSHFLLWLEKSKNDAWHYTRPTKGSNPDATRKYQTVRRHEKVHEDKLLPE